jgi:hypothetical protein
MDNNITSSLCYWDRGGNTYAYVISHSPNRSYVIFTEESENSNYKHRHFFNTVGQMKRWIQKNNPKENQVPESLSYGITNTIRLNR